MPGVPGLVVAHGSVHLLLKRRLGRVAHGPALLLLGRRLLVHAGVALAGSWREPVLLLLLLWRVAAAVRGAVVDGGAVGSAAGTHILVGRRMERPGRRTRTSAAAANAVGPSVDLLLLLLLLRYELRRLPIGPALLLVLLRL